MSDMGISSHEANGVSVKDMLHRQEITSPPHEDQMESAIESKLAAVLQEQNAYAKRRLEVLYQELENLKKVMDTTSKKAHLALKAHTQTLVSVRVHTEKLGEVVRELAAGHEELKHLYDN